MAMDKRQYEMIFRQAALRLLGMSGKACARAEMNWGSRQDC